MVPPRETALAAANRTFVDWERPQHLFEGAAFSIPAEGIFSTGEVNRPVDQRGTRPIAPGSSQKNSPAEVGRRLSSGGQRIARSASSPSSPAREGAPRCLGVMLSSCIMTCERMFRSRRTRPTHARSSGSEMLLHTRSLVGSIIDTRESSFRKRQRHRIRFAQKLGHRSNRITLAACSQSLQSRYRSRFSGPGEKGSTRNVSDRASIR